jgi:hypothetical protein
MPIIVVWNTPFFIVVRAIEFIGRPGASLLRHVDSSKLHPHPLATIFVILSAIVYSKKPAVPRGFVNGLSD